MNRVVVVLIVIIFSLPGCTGCLSKLYAVHEEIEYLDLTFVNSSLSDSSVLNYFDSVLKLDTANYVIQDSLNGLKLGDDERIIYFKKNPNEYYQVSINAFPCWIKGIFNEKIDRFNWVYSRSKVKDSELKRIENRFKNEILSKVPGFVAQ